MRTLDKFEQIAWDAEYGSVILSNGQDFELVDLGGEPLSEDARLNLSKRGLAFVGLIALVGGRPRVALDTPLDPETGSRITAAFVRRIEDKINSALRSQGGLEWLTRLSPPAPLEN